MRAGGGPGAWSSASAARANRPASTTRPAIAAVAASATMASASPREVASVSRVKVVDPSFRNWPALEYAVLKNIVPDFPLCNKSFNLSYSGSDL